MTRGRGLARWPRGEWPSTSPTVSCETASWHAELEPSERGVVTADAQTLEQLRELKSLGVRIAIDDFGTGQSMLAYLKDLPLNTLKIDRSFICGLPNEQNDEAIVCAIIAMAHRLGFAVTAEGVETLEQAQFLSSNRCDELQGALFGMPVTPSQLPHTLARNPWNPVVRPVRE